MIASGLHSDYDAPPCIPAFGHGKSPKKRRQESLCDTLAGAAVAVVHALKPTTSPTQHTGLSPGKTIDLRTKSYEQLLYLKKLHNEGILNESEQKENVLSSLRKLTDLLIEKHSAYNQ